ncbi:unnamed protein product [Pleuronectes platessa]|uniref:Uncharacterized protein n=1 Tax=Pleuronectes platessa TaxID=8262 RepID=A0A9N7W3G8_PLEPL|nr:unnamed protein product [Pleuronectes platessa]
MEGESGGRDMEGLLGEEEGYVKDSGRDRKQETTDQGAAGDVGLRSEEGREQRGGGSVSADCRARRNYISHSPSCGDELELELELGWWWQAVGSKSPGRARPEQIKRPKEVTTLVNGRCGDDRGDERRSYRVRGGVDEEMNVSCARYTTAAPPS